MYKYNNPPVICKEKIPKNKAANADSLIIRMRRTKPRSKSSKIPKKANELMSPISNQDKKENINNQSEIEENKEEKKKEIHKNQSKDKRSNGRQIKYKEGLKKSVKSKIINIIF